MKLSKPQKSELVLIDANVFILMTEGFLDQCVQILKDLTDREVSLILPQIVKCELLKNSLNPVVYKQVEQQINDSFAVLDVDTQILDAACKLNALYHWSPSLRNKVQKKNILNDMIIGAMAALTEKGSQLPSYILSEDGDFMSPYFLEVEYVGLLSEDGKALRYLRLYRVNRDQANADWQTYISQDGKKRNKTNAWTTALKTIKPSFKGL
jgi:hypothetical protein